MGGEISGREKGEPMQLTRLLAFGGGSQRQKAGLFKKPYPDGPNFHHQSEDKNSEIVPKDRRKRVKKPADPHANSLRDLTKYEPQALEPGVKGDLTSIVDG